LTAREGEVVKQTIAHNGAPAPIVDYSAARERAIKWLGDRYLLARPINADWRRTPSSSFHSGPAGEERPRGR
jgi:hypothetical protein